MISPKQPKLNQQVTILKALGHPSRLWIVKSLMEENLSVRDLQMGLGQDMSTVSRHLLVLRNAGILRFEKHGQFSIYQLNCERIEDLFEALDGLKASPRTGITSRVN